MAHGADMHSSVCRFTSWLLHPPKGGSLARRCIRTSGRYACIGLIGCVIPFLWPIGVPVGLWQRWRASRHQAFLRGRNEELRAAGRLIGLDQLAERLDRGEGTLVLILWLQHLTEQHIERAASEKQAGWSGNWNDVWWTPKKPWEIEPSPKMLWDSFFAPHPPPDENGLIHFVIPDDDVADESLAIFSLAGGDSREFVAALWADGVRCEVPDLGFVKARDESGGEPIGPEWRWFRKRFTKVPILVLFG